MTSLANIAAATTFLLLTVSVLGLVIGLISVLTATSSVDYVAALKFTKYYALTTLILAPIAVLLRKKTVTSILEGFIVVCLSWLLIPLLSMFSYVITIGMNPIDAYFESLSGFSGTGLTMIPKPENCPHVVLLWRAVTQWVGELGVVVFTGTLLPRMHRVIHSVYIVERGERIAPTIVSTMRRLLGIYMVYTAVGTLVLMIGGMSFFDALTHTMTAIATGGMSTNSMSIGHWFHGSNWVIYWGTIALMILGALNFADHDLLFRGRIREFLTSTEVKGFFGLLAFFTALLAGYAFIVHEPRALVTWFYHLVSGYTTTGFQLGPSQMLYRDPDFVKVVFIVSMVVGGATFSTAGGIKIRRAIIALKAIVWSSAKIFAPPTMVMRMRVGKSYVEESDVVQVLTFIAMYMITLVGIALFIHATLIDAGIKSFSFIDALFETASALSCVGLSVGITSPTMPMAAKVALMIAMYLGRLEFAPLYLAMGWGYISKKVL